MEKNFASAIGATVAELTALLRLGRVLVRDNEDFATWSTMVKTTLRRYGVDDDDGGKPPVLRGEAHRMRHKQLHAALDELVADFFDHAFRSDLDSRDPMRLPSNTPIAELMEWSARQTDKPDELP